MGNVTCYTYDSLHRLASKTYPSDPYSSITQPKYYTYDTAAVNGQTMNKRKEQVG